MRELKTITTKYNEYTNSYEGEFENCFQIHIYSLPQIISTYYNTSNSTLESVKNKAYSVLKTIRKRSDRGNQISIFETNGKFLITEYTELIDQGEVLAFNEENMRYNYQENEVRIEDYLGNRKIDDFIKESLISVGAEELYEIVKPFATSMRKNNDTWEQRNEELRTLNKSSPQFILEIYSIEKDYKPILTHAYQIYNIEAMFLPEYYDLIRGNTRVTYLVKDLNTNKVIDGSLEEAIESIKYEKWLKKNPPTIDLNDLQRMELDSDDLNFLNYDDYTANDDEFEEGDDEYSPKF